MSDQPRNGNDDADLNRNYSLAFLGGFNSETNWAIYSPREILSWIREQYVQVLQMDSLILEPEERIAFFNGFVNFLETISPEAFQSLFLDEEEGGARDIIMKIAELSESNREVETVLNSIITLDLKEGTPEEKIAYLMSIRKFIQTRHHRLNPDKVMSKVVNYLVALSNINDEGENSEVIKWGVKVAYEFVVFFTNDADTGITDEQVVEFLADPRSVDLIKMLFNFINSLNKESFLSMINDRIKSVGGKVITL